VEPLVFETKLDKVARRPGWFAFAARSMSATVAGEDIGIAVVEVLVITKEVVNDELLFLDMICRARSASPHLLVEDRAAHPAAHHQMENFPAVEAGIQHADADGYLGIALALELADEIVGVCNVAGDNLGVLTFKFGMQCIQIVSQTGGVALGDSEDDSLSRTNLLTWSKFLASGLQVARISTSRSRSRLEKNELTMRASSFL